jgi:hypothetical protein
MAPVDAALAALRQATAQVESDRQRLDSVHTD